MTYLIFKQYKELGYTAVAEEEFVRWSVLAESYVRLYMAGCLDRRDAAADNLIPLLNDNELRGMSELVDLLYKDYKQINRRLMSFSNGQYTETYGLPSRTTTVSTQQKVLELLALYFSADDLYRGV